MRYLYYRVLQAMLAVAAFVGPLRAAAGAADLSGGLSARVTAAQRSGTAFREVRLFRNIRAAKHTAILAQETLLQPDIPAISALFATKPYAIRLSLRSDEGKDYVLELLQAQPLADAPTTGIIDFSGRKETGYTPGLHYQGRVAGEERSMAAVSVFANGDVMVLFAGAEGNFVAGRLEDNSGNYIFYNDKAMLRRPGLPCGVTDAPEATGRHAAKGSGVLMCNKVRIYWEVSYNFFTAKNSNLALTQNYITGLFNQFQAVYANDNIAVELKSFYIWTTQDDYPTSGSSAALNKFRGYWNTMDNSFDGDIAHLLTRDNAGNGGGNGGLAYVDVLCNRNYGYAYSDIYGSLQTVPTYSWDVEVVSHETGHNMGSKHTHWCGWNTGTGGSCGSIDNCTTQEADGNCTTCPSTYSNSAATSAWKGTIMSYCHLVARGISLANGFGPLPGALIRDNVSNESCLSGALNAILTPTPACAGNDGAITLTYAAGHFGTAPYTYSWPQGRSTKDIAGLAPGSYSVTITDSNGCSGIFGTTVGSGLKAGNGMAVTEQLPVCCRSTARQLTISATPPTSLRTGCETVYWLRGETPPVSLAELQVRFDTAQPAQILPSSNAAGISATTGARLSISPPQSCTGPVTYYYTPIAVRLPHSADSVVSTVTAGTAFQNGSVQLGSILSLPDQQAALSSCLADDTAAVQSLTVNVTAYTGRANNMRLIVQDAADAILYQKFGLAGTGTYSIPPAAVKGNFLQALKITVLDFNCTTGNASTCGTTTVTMNATRRLVYNATAIRLAPACMLSNPVRVDFAPDNCTSLATAGPALLSGQPALHPNPARQMAVLQFTTAGSGTVQVKATDLAGRTVWLQEQAWNSGYHEVLLDVHAWAKGMYFITLSQADRQGTSLKLAVE